MKKLHTLTAITAFMGVASLPAATVFVTGAYYAAGAQTATVSGGGVVSLTGGDLINVKTSPQTLTYTISGLDLGGTAVADSVDFQIVLATQTGSNFVTNAGATTFGDGASLINSTGEGGIWTYVADSMTVNIDGVADSGSGTFDGFTALLFNNFTGTESANVNGDVFTATSNGSAKYTLPSLTDSIDMVWVAGSFKASTVDFQFTAVPEPGTYALLAGLTGLVFVMVRRRR